MAEVVVIRPGCTDYDEQHRVAGALRLPLNVRGKDQVLRLVELVRDLPLTVIYSSPDDPAKSTAETLGRQLNVPVKLAEELRNVNQGLWQGLHVDDVRRMYPRVCKQWRESPANVCPPEGEPIRAAAERLQRFLAKPLKKCKSFCIVASEPLATLVRCIVTHGEIELPKSMCGDDSLELAEVLTIGRNGSAGVSTNGAAPDAANSNGPDSKGTTAHGHPADGGTKETT